uniref:Prefoldin subunit 6 n=1 Tax=Heterorhabditis bacteriophora TaxID=37862 RepID=A0A1I7WIS7_HETBA
MSAPCSIVYYLVSFIRRGRQTIPFIILGELAGDRLALVAQFGDHILMVSKHIFTKSDFTGYPFVYSNVFTFWILVDTALCHVILQERCEPFETTHLVSEEVYTKAVVPKPDKVSIWLGANVMVEYDLDKAKDLLEKNKNSVTKVVDELTSELAYVKDQITTTEVNIAHVYNYGVKKRAQVAGPCSCNFTIISSTCFVLLYYSCSHGSSVEQMNSSLQDANPNA